MNRKENMSTAIRELRQILLHNRKSNNKGVYSVCCTNENVLRATFLFAKDKTYPLVIESTSNQVDQFGGYTGMHPHEFVSYIYALADELSYPKERIILGGDHLGPNAWQNLPAAQAMEHAKTLVATYIKAGYRKIHLDASMACVDDTLTGWCLPDSVVADRAAILCKVAEETWELLPKQSADGIGTQGERPVYIIGTEVPVPGGSKENEEHVEVTNNSAAQTTFRITKRAFENQGLGNVWSRVVAMVVQPGVEFSDDNIFFYNPEASKPLSSLCNSFELIYEAHSTDYQTKEGLRDLVLNHYAILKVGPWLTFAYREALCSLASIEQHMITYKQLTVAPSKFLNNVEQYLKNNNKYWKKYYHGAEEEIDYKCIFSLSDRIRYYWPIKEMQEFTKKLLSNLGDTTILPYSLVSQYFPEASKLLSPKEYTAKRLINIRIQAVLSKYEFAIS